jgi:hypothetical protein
MTGTRKDAIIQDTKRIDPADGCKMGRGMIEEKVIPAALLKVLPSAQGSRRVAGLKLDYIRNTAKSGRYCIWEHE